jgi:hypothetical protein
LIGGESTLVRIHIRRHTLFPLAHLTISSINNKTSGNFLASAYLLLLRASSRRNLNFALRGGLEAVAAFQRKHSRSFEEAQNSQILKL